MHKSPDGYSFMNYRGVEISANRWETEPWRLSRLADVVDSMPDALRARVASLHDHKGDLTVRWRDYLYCENHAENMTQYWGLVKENNISHVKMSSDRSCDYCNHNEFDYKVK